MRIVRNIRGKLLVALLTALSFFLAGCWPVTVARLSHTLPR
jgi:hypothetical protein